MTLRPDSASSPSKRADLPKSDPHMDSHVLPVVAVGDAYDEVEALAARSIDCVLTSPPYWGLRSYGHDHDDSVLTEWKNLHPNLGPDELRKFAPTYAWYRANGGLLGLEPYPDWYVSHLVEIFAKFRAKMKPGASLWVNLGDTYFARWSSIRSDGRQGLGGSTRSRRRTPSVGYLRDKQLLLVPARFAIAMQDDGWILRNDLIWAKTAVPPRPEVDRLRLAHEHFFHFVIRPTSGRAKYYYDISKVEDGAKDVVTVSPRAGRDGHSATFSDVLIRPRILSSSPPGGLVVDPFCGTGSTLEVAVSAGRRAHGIEMSATFAEAAKRNVGNIRSLLERNKV